VATKNGAGVLGRIAGAAVILALAAIVGAYWWSNIPPTRPKGLAANSVWLWAPNVGLPAPKRGVWISCSLDGRGRTCHCKTTDKDGHTLYEGPFLSYKRKPASEIDLAINIEETQQHRMDRGVFIRGALVPLVYLKNGDILIPEAKYESVRRTLDGSRQLQ
jgi:hypothetical protein